MAVRPRRPTSRPASRVVKGESTHMRLMGESRIRLICIAVFFSLCFVMLSARLVEVSLLGSADIPFKKLVTDPELLLKSDVDIDISKVAEDEAVTRRDIVDRNGMVLATSISAASLVANPTIIRHETDVAKGLHAIFPDESYDALLSKLMKKRSTFLYLHRHLTPTQQQAVNNLGVPGLFFEPDLKRVYPYGPLFSHVIGYVNTDNEGIAGIEKFYDGQLDDPVNEKPLALSIDLRVQSIVHDELTKTVDAFNALGGTGVVLDMATGEIIAMTSLPEFDPNQPGKASDDSRFNRATLGDYEMGSTFKTFTIAAALEYKVDTLKNGYDASHPIKYGKYTINDAEPMGRWLSIPEIFAYSSNIGAAKMGLDIGARRQQAFLKSLGMFEPVSLEVPELAHPIYPKPQDWRDINTMTIAYGHGMAVTPLHLVRAVAAVAGDGRVMPLTLVKGGNEGKEWSKPVVSAHTIHDMRELLRLVVMAGTAKMADAPGYHVGGKTGTAEKNANGVYSANNKLALFVSAFPINAPRYALLVMVDQPRGNESTHGFATGGWISAPAVGRIVQRMAPLMGMNPDFNHGDPEVQALWAASQPKSKVAAEEQDDSTKGAIHAASF